jgi:hypothetical protein
MGRITDDNPEQIDKSLTVVWCHLIGVGGGD